jgi:hypothetical protein
MALKRSVSERIPWKSIILLVVGGFTGVLILFAFGFMSPGTHLERQNAAIDAAIRPFIADICAAEYARLPAYAENRAALADLKEKNDYEGVRRQVQSTLPALNKRYPFEWSITDKCAERILAVPAVKTALP